MRGRGRALLLGMRDVDGPQVPSGRRLHGSSEVERARDLRACGSVPLGGRVGGCAVGGRGGVLEAQAQQRMVLHGAGLERAVARGPRVEGGLAVWAHALAGLVCHPPVGMLDEGHHAGVAAVGLRTVEGAGQEQGVVSGQREQNGAEQLLSVTKSVGDAVGEKVEVAGPQARPMEGVGYLTALPPVPQWSTHSTAARNRRSLNGGQATTKHHNLTPRGTNGPPKIPHVLSNAHSKHNAVEAPN